VAGTYLIAAISGKFRNSRARIQSQREGLIVVGCVSQSAPIILGPGGELSLSLRLSGELSVDMRFMGCVSIVTVIDLDIVDGCVLVLGWLHGLACTGVFPATGVLVLGDLAWYAKNEHCAGFED
jgi:hypothetical protein